MGFTTGVALLVAAAALSALGGYVVRKMLAPVAERPALDARGDLGRDAKGMEAIESIFERRQGQAEE